MSAAQHEASPNLLITEACWLLFAHSPSPDIAMSAGVLQSAIRQRLLSACHGSLNEIDDLMAGNSTKFQIHPLSYLLCANSGAHLQTSAAACTNMGSLNCSRVSTCQNSLVCYTDASISKCLLVKYCGKVCQRAHWPKHRQDCQHPQLRSDWQPAWVTEKRTPAFVGGPPVVSFGGKSNQNRPGKYVWGNVTAIDCLNIARNESSAARTADLKVCFAGDCPLHCKLSKI